MQFNTLPVFLTLDRGTEGAILDACWKKPLLPIPLEDLEYMRMIDSKPATELFASLQGKVGSLQRMTIYESWFMACCKAHRHQGKPGPTNDLATTAA